MRRVPAGVSRTSLASFRTRKCCETAERLTVIPAAIPTTDDGHEANCSTIARRVGSPRAFKARAAPHASVTTELIFV
jgi:hypothetical protein